MHRINVRKNKQTKQHQKQWEKIMPMYKGRVSNCRDKRHDGKEEHQYNYTEKWQRYETKINRNFGKIAGLFHIAFQMNTVKEISNFQEYQAKIWD